MRLHTCNENKFNNRVVGSILMDGRGWLYFNKSCSSQFSAEWSFFHRAKSSPTLKLEFGSGDGDNGLTFHASIPWFFSVFISMSDIFGRLFHGKNEPRETGIAFHNGSFWFYPFSKVNSWSSRDGWWNKSHSFSPLEFICGRRNYTEEHDQGWQDIVITMPEGKYKGKLRLFIGTWKNRFRTMRIPRAEIEMEEGIPFPGKGENSWDCGEDATYGITCPAESEEQAICSLIQSVMRSRRQYGSKGCMFNYVPKEVHKRHVPKDDCGKASDQSV
jgi:hypothetical protein